MTSDGRPLFELSFQNEDEIDSVLLSGALTAISAVIPEATQVAGILKQIQIGEQHVIIHVSDEYTGVIFTDLPSPHLNEILLTIMNEIIKIQPDIDKIASKEEKSISKIVKNAFELN
jgi:hypothetical protein